MSRNCYECSEDEKCILQNDGVYSCSNGSPKTQDRQLQDLNDYVLSMLPRLYEIRREYKALNNPKKAKSITQIIGLIKQEYHEDIAAQNRRMQIRALRVACGSEEK